MMALPIAWEEHASNIIRCNVATKMSTNLSLISRASQAFQTIICSQLGRSHSANPHFQTTQCCLPIPSKDSQIFQVKTSHHSRCLGYSASPAFRGKTVLLKAL